jgi:peptide/nickel transport system substrate-binding protein
MTAFSKRTALAALTALALVVSACGSDGETGDSAETTGSTGSTGSADATTDGGTAGAGTEVDTMTWAIQSPPASMDNAVAGDVPTFRVQSAAFDGITTLDNDGVVQPWLASSFENPDPLTWVFTIRDDVTFWDGTPMTAEDVAYSWSRHVGVDSTSVQAFNFANVASVEATDDSTVTVTLTAPDPGIPAKAALYVHVQQKAYIEEAGDALGGPDSPGMGTGPFSITSYSSADGATLTRFDDYWAGDSKVGVLEFVVISDPDTARLAMSSGEIDGFFDVPLIATRQWDDLDNATMTYVTGAYNDMLTMDVSSAPFDDVKVREAMGHLIDREGLLAPLFNDRATSAYTIVPATQFESSLGADGAAALYEELPAVPEFSIDLAREALAASASPDGFEVDLPVDTTQPWMSPLAQSLAENASEIGITVNVVPVSSADWIDGLFEGPLQLLALGAGTPWPAEIPIVVVGTDAGFNLSRYAGEEVDPLVADVAAATTLDELMPPLTELLTLVGNDVPYIPLFDEQVAVAISNDFVWEGGFSYWALAQPWPLQLGGAG